MKPVACTGVNIYNGGVTFQVLDEGEFGPSLEITSSSFGNMNHTFQIYLTPDSLHDLAEVFKKAAEHKFTGQYVHAAKCD